MAGPLAGVRVLEVATHVFVPISGAVLCEWGAEVIKVEHPDGGDPYRGLVTAGMQRVHHGVDTQFQATNRGKRSVAIDLKQPDGRRLLGRLLAGCDVFVTNLRPDARRRLRIDVDDIRADNPDIVYVRGSAFGQNGPEAERGGYDSGAYWARTGMQQIFTAPGSEWPANPRPAFGDVVGGLTIAGAISTALFQRASTGTAPVVDVALLGVGMWQIQMDILNATLNGPGQARQMPTRYDMPNPLMMPYKTSDGRIVSLQLLSPDRFWPDVCRVIGEPDKATDPRFADIHARRQNNRECIEWLESVFAARTYDEWRKILTDFAGEWVPTVDPSELATDEQVSANGFMSRIDVDGVEVPFVTAPVEFDGARPTVRRAPELGEDTETVLADLGIGWDEIGPLKASGAIL